MGIEVELFSSPGCSRCARAKQTLQSIVDDLGVDRIRWRPVDVVEEIDHAVSLGVLSTPAIAIDGKLVFTSMPSERKLRRALEQRLKEASP